MYNLLLLISHLVFQVASLPSIDKATLESLNRKPNGNILITMTKSIHSVLQPFQNRQFETREDRINTLVTQLQSFAKSSQKKVMEILKISQSAKDFNVETLWITNQIIVWKADSELISRLLVMEDILSIQEEGYIPFEEPMDFQLFESVSQTNRTEYGWGVKKVSAPEVWSLGETGQGIIVGSIDTGVRLSHNVLRNNFLGEYGWYDAVNKLEVPYDDFGHGTAVTAVMAGSQKIGIAPGSKWSACKACGPAGCSRFLLLTCGQWVACPTNLNGSTSDCSKAPHVVSNSWGGQVGNDWFNEIAKVWHSAGIISVFAIGNSGPKCMTANSPGDYENVIGVGASCRNDTVARFSSAGPSKIGRLVKPDIVAPGHRILTAYNRHDKSHATLSGSSMASPCAAGVIALLLGKDKSLGLTGVRKALQAGGEMTMPKGFACSDKDDSLFPNYHAGYGRINALRSLRTINKTTMKV